MKQPFAHVLSVGGCGFAGSQIKSVVKPRFVYFDEVDNIMSLQSEELKTMTVVR